MPLLLFILVALLLLLLAILRSIGRRQKRPPPGPWGLPIIGYLPWIDSKAPHETLTSLTRRYGPVCALKMGSVYTVLLSDPRLVRQVLAKDSFSGRAPLYLTHGIMGGYGLICAEGKLWREQRRFAVSCLKNLGMLKFGAKRDQLEARITAAVDESVSKLLMHSGKQGVDPFETLHHCLGNLMNRIVFGKDYREDDVVWKWLRHLQEEGVKHIGVAGPLNFLPILRLLPRFSKMFDYLIDGKRKTHEVYKQIIAEHRNQVDNGEKTMDSVLAAFDDEMRRRMDSDDPGHFTEPQYLHFLADLFGASTDTTLATIRWFLLFMVAYPDEQLKIQQELDAVLRGKNVSLEDRSALPYLEAAIAETQRIRSVVPVGIPHGTIEDTLIAGYEVPKGSMVVPLQWAIHMNPNYWQDPTKFKPERFIAQDGSLAKPEAFLPFQTGKRMCLGEDLAKMMLFLFTGRILQRFNLTSPEDQPLDLTGECGITLTPKPYRLIFTSRS